MNKNLYYILDNEVLVSNCLEFINAEKIVKESAKAIIRTLPSYRQVNNIFSCFREKKGKFLHSILFIKSVTPHCSLSNIHTVGEHLPEINSSEIIIIQNLGAKNNREVFMK